MTPLIFASPRVNPTRHSRIRVFLSPRVYSDPTWASLSPRGPNPARDALDGKGMTPSPLNRAKPGLEGGMACSGVGEGARRALLLRCASLAASRCRHRSCLPYKSIPLAVSPIAALVFKRSRAIILRTPYIPPD